MFGQFISSKIWQFRESPQLIIYSISRKERITSELVSYPTISYKRNSLMVFNLREKYFSITEPKYINLALKNTGRIFIWTTDV